MLEAVMLAHESSRWRSPRFVQPRGNPDTKISPNHQPTTKIFPGDTFHKFMFCSSLILSNGAGDILDPDGAVRVRSATREGRGQQREA